MVQRVLRWCHQWNDVHPWDHNAHYHRWILRHLPASFDRALDVGCGTGDLVRRLRTRARSVHGIDLDQTTIAIARRHTSNSSGVEFSTGDFMDLHPTGRYDVITALAVVHHMPLAPALRRLHDDFAPGGALVILGCYREQTRSDWLLGIIAVPANVIVGGLKTPRRLASGRARQPVSTSAPTAAATMTLAEIRDVAACELPGSHIRRHLFWRYSITFRNPPRVSAL